MLLLTTFGAILEAAGVGLVLPFVSIIISDDFMLPSLIVEWFPFSAHLSKHQLILMTIIFFLLFYLCKSVFLLWLVFCQSSYFYSVQENISNRLFSSYLKRDYIFHIKNNSGKLLSNTITESTQFAQGFASSVLLLLNDILIVFMIAVVLFFVEPVGAIISIAIFGFIAIILIFLSKSRAKVWGEARQQKEQKRIKWAQQGFSGVKDIKLYGRERLFLDQYQYQTNISLTAGRNQTVLQNVPRIFLEFVSVSALCILIAFLFFSGRESEIFATVSLFTAAAFKLLPTIARLVQSTQAMLFNLPVVSLIYSELSEQRLNQISELSASIWRPNNLTFDNKITFEKVSFGYEGAEQQDLKSISLAITKGKMFGFIGPSGAGKSTLIDCLLGLIIPSSGAIKIDGQPIDETNLTSWQRKIGYVPQSIYLLDGSLRDNVAFGLAKDVIDDGEIENAIRLAQLSDFVENLPNGMDTVVGERGVRLSGGQRQRIGIARALYNNPEILVFDEATSSLDINTERDVMEEIEALSGTRTIIIIAHRLSTIKNCDYIFQLENGAIVNEGHPSDILNLDFKN